MNFLLLVFAAGALSAADINWPHYGNDPGGTRYSAIAQITPKNVTGLKQVWEYHTGALIPETHLKDKAAFEATPIVVDGTLYLSTPFDQVIALDPTTGKERWVYDPKVDRTANYSEVTSRGVSLWTDSKRHKGDACWRRIFIGTIDARLIAIDAANGKVCSGFGEIDLTKAVAHFDEGNWHDYQVTSPPAVIGDLVVTGSSIGDNRMANSERGIVRAFDARTGALRWSFDPLPAGLKNAGAGNAWSVLAADPARDMVFIPTGSASPDFYGGERPGNNGYANSVVAIRASTGKVVWSFQVVHHDLWDYDVASQPTLITFRRGNQKIPAVAVTSKTGHFFVLNRMTGKSLLPIEERPVPKSRVPGEESSPTQPFPKYDTLAPQKFSADDAWGITPEEQAWCKSRLTGLDSNGLFTPPSLEGTIIFPGNVGGVNWGGAAYEPHRGLLVVASNRLSTIVKLVPRDKVAEERKIQKDNRFDSEFGMQKGTPYAMVREHLRAPSGLPCNAPPWSELIAVDLSTGMKNWQVPLGEVLLGNGKSIPGALSMGGPMVTGGGLIFVAATVTEQKLRAFDVETGRELWSAELPASAQSTPMTYSIGGKQYVVICAGGHGKIGNKMGDSVVAFALP
ncbi:MAG TPA: pyrroloquinoline quinone-dependent dehydrogenase [Bryobacteraceae bacterium]|nr:pyrroloquinoline quinone-dependent dehydrogenase [Bryobacteraceae bacterium]